MFAVMFPWILLAFVVGALVGLVAGVYATVRRLMQVPGGADVIEKYIHN